MMSSTIESTPNPAAGTGPPTAIPAIDDLYRLTVDEYERLADAGVLNDRRVELIDGLLVKKMTAKPAHVVAVDATSEALARLLPPGWWLRQEKPVRIPDFDEPEPDVSVVRGTRLDYRARHPGPGDIGLLVEVSDTTLAWDRGQKRAAYARAGVPTYWILNLVGHQLEIYTQPQPTDYRDCRILGLADQAPFVLVGAEVGLIAVAELLS